MKLKRIPHVGLQALFKELKSYLPATVKKEILE